MQQTSYLEAQKSVTILKENGLDLGYGCMWRLVENTNGYIFKNAYSAQSALVQKQYCIPKNRGCFSL